VKVRRCEDVKVKSEREREREKMCEGCRCEDVKIKRCEDVSVCEGKKM